MSQRDERLYLVEILGAIDRVLQYTAEGRPPPSRRWAERHADFMAGFFREQRLRAVAVHSGDTSAPRAKSLKELQAGFPFGL